MYDDEEWNAIRPQPVKNDFMSSSALRFSLLFGGTAIAAALLLVPVINPNNPRSLTYNNSYGVDSITTATIRKPERTYIVRRSVLQSSPSDVCIIQENGSYEGAC